MFAKSDLKSNIFMEVLSIGNQEKKFQFRFPIHFTYIRREDKYNNRF